MKITEKQKCIAEQSVYGDLIGGLQFGEIAKIRYISGIDVYLNLGVSDISIDIDIIKPILRPLSDLTKEIIHKGYNDSYPFETTTKLSQICDWIKLVLLTSENSTRISYVGVDVSSDADGGSDLTLSDLQPFYDILNLLHFDTRGLIDQGDAIDVNLLPKNPYE